MERVQLVQEFGEITCEKYGNTYILDVWWGVYENVPEIKLRKKWG